MLFEEEILKQRRMIIELVYKTGIEAHISSALSIVEILNVLLKDTMYLENKDLDHINSDRLVISKGHASLALYVLYAELGYISESELWTYRKKDSRLGVHPDRYKVPGVLVSTGSLGHGFPNAVGIAYAWKINGMNNHMFVIVGDGEMNEGSNWEAMLFAARMQLNNITCIIDNNHSADNIPVLGKKFRSFGWEVSYVDGHNTDRLKVALERRTDRPYAVIAETIKGKGIGIIENDSLGWHSRCISKREYQEIMEALI